VAEVERHGCSRPGAKQQGRSFDEQLVEAIRRRVIASEHLDLVIARTCTHAPAIYVIVTSSPRRRAHGHGPLDISSAGCYPPQPRRYNYVTAARVALQRRQ